MRGHRIFIVGQTASGKSQLAMKVARKYSGEIICADSLTVYQGLDIGTAKPSAEEQAEIPHHLLDIVKPGDDSFSVIHFKEYSLRAIADIESRNKLPIIVGGSGLYIDSLLFDFSFRPIDKEARMALENKSIEELQSMIVDNSYKMPENRLNKRYLIRTIESNGLLPVRKNPMTGSIVVGVRRQKDDLRTRIEKRIKLMLKQGVIEEVQWAIYNYPRQSEARKGNIYANLEAYLNNEKTLDQAIDDAIRADLKLAKKQNSWFRRNPHINWFDDDTKAFDFIESSL